MTLSKKQIRIIAITALFLLAAGTLVYLQVYKVKKTSRLTPEEYYQELNGR